MTKTDNVAGLGMRAEISDLLIILSAPPRNAPELLFFGGLLNSTWIQPTGDRQIQVREEQSSDTCLSFPLRLYAGRVRVSGAAAPLLGSSSLTDLVSFPCSDQLDLTVSCC